MALDGPRIGGIPSSDLVDQSLPTLTPGSTETFQLYFAIGQQSAEDTNGAFDYTFTITGSPETERGAYDLLTDYAFSARDGTIQTGTDDAGIPWFRERLPEKSAETHLARIYPEQTDVPEMWGVITDITDQSVSNRPFARVDVDVFILGRADDYADAGEVRDEHEVTLGWVVAGEVADALTDDTVPTLTRGEESDIQFRFDDLSSGAYQAIRDYLAYPNVSTYTTDNAVPRFRDRTPNIAPVDDTLIKVEPDHDAPGYEDFWAVVIGGEDSAAPRPSERIISLTLYKLGTVDEYPTEADVRDALEVASV